MTRDRWLRVFAHRDRLLRIARARVPAEAEDVVQEAMLRAATFESLDDDRLGELLTSVTVRLCVDEHRRQSRAERLRRRIPYDRDEEPAPDEQVCARAEAEWAAGVVRQLPPMQQLVLSERADGLSFEEISRRHRVSYKSAESSASRARAYVRRALATTLAALGVVRRPAVVTPTAVTAVAYVALVLGHVPAPAHRDQRVARPPARHDVTRDAHATTPLVTRTARQTEATRAGRSRTTRVVAARPKPSPSPSPYVQLGEASIAPDERHDDYSTPQRLKHCLRYGVDTYPTIQCRYPDDPDRGGTP